MARSHSKRSRLDLQHLDIPTKANRILHFILIALILIIMRVWHLAVIQYDQKLEESRKPQRKVVIEPATRATIRDRFNLPLAINRVHYQATILYSQLREIPSFVWQKDENGKRIKVFKRREYIHQLAELLARELNLDAERIEDLIHAKASYYSQVPFIIKEEVSEAEYYRLKMLEKDWPGIYMRRLPKRYYPRGRVAADIIGYMGAINRQEYEKILQEMKILEQLISEREDGIENELPEGIETTAQARKRLKDLEDKAYTIHDYVGKTGIEGVYEEQLRGFYGKKSFYSDSKGNFLRELPGSRAPLSGHRILLTISAELQEYAEQLLAQNEELRLVRKSGLGAIKKTILAQKHPWIKSGAVVVMDPYTAEILTLASYPRFDPNDFIASGQGEEQKQKKRRINRWFENEAYLADVWDQQQPLERERYDSLSQTFYDEQRPLSWPAYLDFILPAESPLRSAVNRITDLNQAIYLQRYVKELTSLYPDWDPYTIFNCLYTADEHEPYLQPAKASERQKQLAAFQIHQDQAKDIKKKLDAYLDRLPQNYDKVLLVDLCRLAVDEERFTPELLEYVGNNPLETYRKTTGSLIKLTALVKEFAKELFHDNDFREWRKNEEKNFLKVKRAEEKAAKTYPKPYLDYLDQYETHLFKAFWEHYRWDLLLVFLTGNPSFDTYPVEWTPYQAYFSRWYQELGQGAYQAVEWREAYDIMQKALKPLPIFLRIAYLRTMRPYQELTRPLLGRYRYLRSHKDPLEKHLAAAFYPIYGFGYARSHAYRQATIQGSLFKLVTSYAALIQQYHKLDKKVVSFLDLNPLTIIDEVYTKGQTRYVGYTEDGKPIPQLYKGGRLPRSLAHQHNGRVDLIRALEVSSNPYFSLLAGECLDSPDDLSQAARLFSYGSRTGIDLPGEIAGKVPQDLTTNRTGLYAMAIGQHSLVVTPLQTAVMLSAIANGGKVLKPKIVNLTAGREPLRGEDQIACPPYFAYQDSLSLIGVDFPLFTAIAGKDQESLVKTVPTETRKEIFMPEIVRQIILKGLRAAALRTHQESLSSLTRLYQQHPEAIRHFTELKDQLLGKTSTSESVENIDLDLNEGASIYTHVWFGSIAFQKDQNDKNKNVFILKDEFGQPELVVVVYLRFGGYGKEAAPLAAQIVKKWRELKEKYDK
ncbi:penicillin-binding transpeptidase domain-containing protein [Candidatus Protochlamydia phocaeensis]|uniref:penicillin-binding transpeptidase domain-containing protein n=1 Tax=Candidatus Protochlamydia phocaeensis TaxID=1414722 RepID=UPI000838AADA|nr:penicillin-binding transpeptidase domain-containing protein [Candidatus Protochlamydia phocaeensis]